MSLNKEGYFDIKLYYSKSIPIEEVFETSSWRAGEVIDEKYYYDLQATDIQGRLWEASGIIPTRDTGPGGAIIYGKASQIEHRAEDRSNSQNNFMRLIFNSDINFSTNSVVETEKQIGGKIRNQKWDSSAAKFSASGIEFEVENESGVTYLSACSKDVSFADKVIDGVFDAFCFVTGYMQSWSLLEMRDGSVHVVKVRPSWPDTKKGRVGPPLSSDSHVKDYWIIFGKYLAYHLETCDEQNISIGALIRAVQFAGKSALEVEALTLSVSVESLLKEEFGNILEKDELLIEQITKLKSLIKNTGELDKNFKKRIKGLLGGMPNPRAIDFLYWMRNQGLLEEDLVKAYGDLRNRAAHGEGVNWADIQVHINRCASVLVLFYQLIFLAIGYTGKYVDYGTYNYPVREFKSSLDMLK